MDKLPALLLRGVKKPEPYAQGLSVHLNRLSISHRRRNPALTLSHNRHQMNYLSYHDSNSLLGFISL